MLEELALTIVTNIESTGMSIETGIVVLVMCLAVVAFATLGIWILGKKR
jgi:hypothetical protein